MPWNPTPVQTTGPVTGNSSLVETHLPGNVTVGNLLVQVISASAAPQPVNDGYERDAEDGFKEEFTSLSFYFRRVAPGDSVSGLRDFARTLGASDRWDAWGAEFEGAGPWTTATIKDKSVSNELTSTSTSISTGSTATLDQPDGLVLVALGMPRILNAGTGAFSAYTNGFTELVQFSAAGGDQPTLAVLVKDVGNTVAAVEMTATIGPLAEHRPLAILHVFKTDPPVTIRPYLSGGSANADPDLSLGGAESSVEMTIDLLDPVGRLQADQAGGWEDYRVIYPRNIENLRGMSASTKVLISQTPANWDLALAVPDEEAGETVPPLEDENTPPGGLEFTSPTTSETALDMGILGHEQSRGLVIRRQVAQGAEAFESDTAKIKFLAEPG